MWLSRASEYPQNIFWTQKQLFSNFVNSKLFCLKNLFFLFNQTPKALKKIFHVPNWGFTNLFILCFSFYLRKQIATKSINKQFTKGVKKIEKSNSNVRSSKEQIFNVYSICMNNTLELLCSIEIFGLRTSVQKISVC